MYNYILLFFLVYFFMLQPKSSFVVFYKSLENIWEYGVLSQKIALVRIKNGFFYKYGHYSSLPDFESNILTSCSVFKFLYFTHTPYRTIVHSRELKAQWTEFFFLVFPIFFISLPLHSITLLNHFLNQ